jgi:hypothetical protein
MRDLIKKLDQIEVVYVGVGTARRDGQLFAGLQVNYGKKADKFSVSVSFTSVTFLGSSGDTVHKAIVDALAKAESYGYLVMDKQGAQFHSFHPKQ